MANYIKKIAGNCCSSTNNGTTLSLSELTDVDVLNPIDGQMLKYNGTTEKWEPIGGYTEVTQDNIVDIVKHTVNLVYVEVNMDDVTPPASWADDPRIQAILANFVPEAIYQLYARLITGEMVPLEEQWAGEYHRNGQFVIPIIVYFDDEEDALKVDTLLHVITHGASNTATFAFPWLADNYYFKPGSQVELVPGSDNSMQ